MSPDPLPPVPPRRSTLLSILLALLVFVGGAGVGSAVTLVVVGKRLQDAAQRPELMPGRMAERLGDKLDLDPRQRRKVEKVLEAHNRELMGMRRDSARRMRPPLRRMADDVARELTPRQERRWREHFDDMVGRFMPHGVTSAMPMPPHGRGHAPDDALPDDPPDDTPDDPADDPAVDG